MLKNVYAHIYLKFIELRYSNELKCLIKYKFKIL